MVSEELVEHTGAVPGSVDTPASLAMEDIEGLDFTMIKLKLQDMEEGPGWSPNQCDEVEAEYKRFLR